MRDTTTDLLSRFEALEARLRTLEAGQSPAAAAATTPVATEHNPAAPSSRRVLLRYGAVALGAAAAAAMPSSSVEAADGDPLITGGSHSSVTSTSIYTIGAPALHGISNPSPNSGEGLRGEGNYFGTTGLCNGTSGSGVFGIAYTPTGNAVGIRGTSVSPNGSAVHGWNSGGGNAVLAEIPAAASANGIALYALNYSAYAGPAPGTGGFAVYGLSAKGHGLVGATAATGAAAVVGATNGVAGAYAGAFYGPLIVSGNFTVVGGAKSAAVPHPDGSHRRLYCVESPESWFEDFGSAKLICGEAVVALDRDFAAVVDTSEYHVFLTANEGPGDLLACDRTSEGFRVKAASGAGDGTFSWRVVAKRRDIAAPRFETVVIPKEPELPPVPASATATEPPRMPPIHRRRTSRFSE